MSGQYAGAGPVIGFDEGKNMGNFFKFFNIMAIAGLEQLDCEFCFFSAETLLHLQSVNLNKIPSTTGNTIL